MYSFTFTANEGYNFLELDRPAYPSKGRIVYLDTSTSTCQIAIDTTGNALYSDYTVDGNNLIRLNSAVNYRFYFNSVTSKKLYYSLTYVTFNYSFHQQHTITAKLNNTYEIVRTIDNRKI